MSKTSKKAKTARGNTYVLTPTGKKHLADVSGQGAIIRDTISRHQPITAAQIVDRVGKSLKSKTPAKNIAFYLCIWKADGFVKFGAKKK